MGGRPVVLVWFKRVWRCVEPACGQRTWSERTVAIRARSVLTERARVECARRVGQNATDVARVATDLGVGWGTVMRAVWEYGQKVLDGQWLHTNVTVLGGDAHQVGDEVSSTPLPTSTTQGRADSGNQARVGVAGHQFDLRQAAGSQVAEERQPAGTVLAGGDVQPEDPGGHRR